MSKDLQLPEMTVIAESAITSESYDGMSIVNRITMFNHFGYNLATVGERSAMMI